MGAILYTYCLLTCALELTFLGTYYDVQIVKHSIDNMCS